MRWFSIFITIGGWVAQLKESIHPGKIPDDTQVLAQSEPGTLEQARQWADKQEKKQPDQQGG